MVLILLLAILLGSFGLLTAMDRLLGSGRIDAGLRGLVPRFSRLAGLCLIALLVLVLPANVYAAFNRVEMGGHGAGPAYLFLRVPFQFLLIGWAYWFAVRRGHT